MVNVRYLIAAKTKTKTVNYQLLTINYHFIPCPNENLFIR